MLTAIILCITFHWSIDPLSISSYTLFKINLNLNVYAILSVLLDAVKQQKEFLIDK
jgi:hypothetical protein